MKKSSDTIGNWTCDLLVCSTVPKPLHHHVPPIIDTFKYKPSIHAYVLEIISSLIAIQPKHFSSLYISHFPCHRCCLMNQEYYLWMRHMLSELNVLQVHFYCYIQKFISSKFYHLNCWCDPLMYKRSNPEISTLIPFTTKKMCNFLLLPCSIWPPVLPLNLTYMLVSLLLVSSQIMACRYAYDSNFKIWH
jgi:hypothetical protein